MRAKFVLNPRSLDLLFSTICGFAAMPYKARNAVTVPIRKPGQVRYGPEADITALFNDVAISVAG